MRLLERLWYSLRSSALLASYRVPAVWISALVGCVLIVVSFFASGHWAALLGDAGVTVLLVPPLVAVELRTEKIINLQPSDLADLPEVAREGLAQMGTLPARRAANFYRSEMVEAAQLWLGGIDAVNAILPTHTSSRFRLCLAQQVVLEKDTEADKAELQERAEYLAQWPAEGDPEIFEFYMAAGAKIATWFSANDFTFDALGVGTKPRPRGPDLHVLRVVRTDGRFLHVTRPQALEGFSLLMRHEEDGWKVANLASEHEPEPGIPPSGLEFLR